MEKASNLSSPLDSKQSLAVEQFETLPVTCRRAGKGVAVPLVTARQGGTAPQPNRGEPRHE